MHRLSSPGNFATRISRTRVRALTSGNRQRRADGHQTRQFQDVGVAQTDATMRDPARDQIRSVGTMNTDDAPAGPVGERRRGRAGDERDRPEREPAPPYFSSLARMKNWPFGVGHWDCPTPTRALKTVLPFLISVILKARVSIFSHVSTGCSSLSALAGTHPVVPLGRTAAAPAPSARRCAGDHRRRGRPCPRASGG